MFPLPNILSAEYIYLRINSSEDEIKILDKHFQFHVDLYADEFSRSPSLAIGFVGALNERFKTPYERNIYSIDQIIESVMSRHR